MSAGAARAIAAREAPAPRAVSRHGRDAAEREADVAGAAVARNALPTRWSFAAVPVSPPHEDADPRAVDAVAQPGRPLDAGTRRSMEARFRLDLSGVRVHDDARAPRRRARPGPKL